MLNKHFCIEKMISPRNHGLFCQTRVPNFKKTSDARVKFFVRFLRFCVWKRLYMAFAMKCKTKTKNLTVI
jgi:hypothetical protein